MPIEELGSPRAQSHPLRRSLVALLDTSDPHRKQRTLRTRRRGALKLPHRALLTGQTQNKAWRVRDGLLIHSSQELSPSRAVPGTDWASPRSKRRKVLQQWASEPGPRRLLPITPQAILLFLTVLSSLFLSQLTALLSGADKQPFPLETHS